MDRNTILAIILIFGILFTWMTFNNRSQQREADKKKREKAIQDSLARAQGPKLELNPGKTDTLDSAFMALPDSIRMVKLQEARMAEFGVFTPMTKGAVDSIRITTDLMDVRLTTLGGQIEALTLKGYKTWDGKPLPIVAPDTFNKFFLVLFNDKLRTGVMETKKFIFKPEGTEKSITVKGDKSQRVALRSYMDADSYIEYVYTFRGNAYDIGMDVNLVGMKEYLNQGHYFVQWEGVVPKTEKAMSLMTQKSAIYYKVDDDVTYLYPGRPDIQEEEITGTIDWVSFRSQFFSHTLVSKTPVKWMKITQATPEKALKGYGGNDPGKVVAQMTAQMDFPLTRNANETNSFMMYTGPLEFYTLRNYDLDLDDQLNLGWGPLRWINRGIVMPVFKFLEGTIGNYGIIILILAILIKLIVLPMTHRTYISTAKMRIINQTPEIKNLEAKYKDDMMKLNQAKMAIYRQMGVNPMGGCLPALLQYPVLIAMFMFFPNSIELRQQGFLWADDLSTYDSVAEFNFWIPLYGDHVSLFTLLMTISIYLFTFVQQRQQGNMTNNAMLKWLPYIMPLMFLGFLNNYSAGLSYYYFLSNILSIVQTQATKRFVDDESLLRQMKDLQKEREKGGGKGALERWAERQRKKQEELMKNKKKK